MMLVYYVIASASCKLDPSWLVKLYSLEPIPSVTKIVNVSFQAGRVSDHWKISVLKPILKKLSMERLFEKFRSMSNLLFLSEITERAVTNQLLRHCDKIAPLPICQLLRYVRATCTQGRTSQTIWGPTFYMSTFGSDAYHIRGIILTFESPKWHFFCVPSHLRSTFLSTITSIYLCVLWYLRCGCIKGAKVQTIFQNWSL
jgi:hypothetical protein